jgi:phosphohistidine phosphatase
VSTRTLVILRHAKTANPEGVIDTDRPLTQRGHADAAAAGAWLARHDYAVDVVLCSPSRRTRETWHEVALALESAPTVRYESQVYAASARELLKVVRSAPDDASTALLVGHNPGLSELSIILDRAHADPDGLRTAGIAVHSWDGDWVDCGQGTAPLTASHTARG